MNIIKKPFFENLIDGSLNKLGGLSIKIAESSMGKCTGLGLYETTFPQELLGLEEEEK